MFGKEKENTGCCSIYVKKNTHTRAFYFSCLTDRVCTIHCLLLLYTELYQAWQYANCCLVAMLLNANSSKCMRCHSMGNVARGIAHTHTHRQSVREPFYRSQCQIWNVTYRKHKLFPSRHESGAGSIIASPGAAKNCGRWRASNLGDKSRSTFLSSQWKQRMVIQASFRHALTLRE